MSNGDNAARQSEVDAICASGQENVNRYLVTGIMSINERCAQRCAKGSVVDRWTPAAVGTMVASTLAGLLHWKRMSGG